MKAVSSLLLALCLTTSANAATVVSVGDGDTVRVSEGSKRITVRLACIDARESSQRPWWARSTAYLKQLTPVGSEVMLRAQTTDRYGRTVAELLNHRGNVNQCWFKQAKHLLTGGISVSAMQRSIWSLSTTPSNRVVVSGPLGHRASHGLGTTGKGDAAGHQAQAGPVNTAARTLALGVAPNSSWRKETVILMVTVMEKPANRSDDHLLN